MVFNHHQTIDNGEGHTLQVLALARASHTLTSFDSKQRTMGGTLNQLASIVQEAIFFPLQRCSEVWAAIPVKVHLAIFLNRD